MAFLVVQGGSSLYKVDPATGSATALTLPSDITLDTTRKPKFAILNQWVVVTNSPSRNIAIDPEGNVRPLVPRAPVSPPKVAAGSGTGLTGAYQVKQSFVVFDTAGNLLMESPLSPASPSVTITNKDLSVTQVAISSDSISARRLYRTAAGGTSYFQWIDVDGNTTTAIQSNLSDASLALLPAQPTVLTPPPGTLPGTRMKNIVSWKNRLWGVSSDPEQVDRVVYTEDGKVYAWPNALTAYPTGQDTEGIVAFAPRRDQLGIIKRNGLWQIAGSSSATFQVTQIVYGKGGCEAPDSVVVSNDRAYWLSNDGVYEWGPDGIKNISEGTVDPWFTSDTYFNRTRFANAFAKYNHVTDSYELHLAAAGSSSEDRWVSYNIRSKAWFGPHKTDAFTPNHAANGLTSGNLPIVLVGGTDGKVYTANSSTFTDGASTAIDMDVYGPFHHGEAPDIQHLWLELSMLSKKEAGGTLSILPYVGRLDATVGTTISHDLTTGRERLRRLGSGALCRLRFQQNTNAQGATIYGYELPFHELGRR